jgi:glutamate--cysteine ligase
MLAHLVQRLQTLQKQTPYFNTIKRGIERETLRTTPTSQLAPTKHSEKLGSKLTHPHITTDYSENLLEFITSPHTNVDDLLEELMQLHAFTAQSLPDERLWPLSMPCILGTDEEIPIADYGTSHSGRMKMQYRRGLWHRYGRHMQCISGLHYNFSLPDHFWNMWYEQFDPCHHTLQDCINANYLRMIRNYLKHAWLIFIVMGASPACDRSFFVDTPPDFLSWQPPETLFAPHACSLRMSHLGYQSSVQDGIRISYNALEQYIKDLKTATQTPSASYQLIKEKFGDDAQLSTNLLQIEAELYAPIRPKHTVAWGERPLKALETRGIEYIEVRGIDINPYSPIGIEASQIHFLDTFLLFCLLHNSPTFSLDNAMQWHNNQSIAVLDGLSQDCTMKTGDRTIFADSWAAQLFDQLSEVAKLLDQHESSPLHAQAIENHRNAFFSRVDLPASKQLNSLKQGVSYIEFGRALSESHNQALTAYSLPSNILETYQKQAKISLEEQQKMEENQTISYQNYVNSYFNS